MLKASRCVVNHHMKCLPSLCLDPAGKEIYRH